MSDGVGMRGACFVLFCLAEKELRIMMEAVGVEVGTMKANEWQ
jgi:hypothetical protein